MYYMYNTLRYTSCHKSKTASTMSFKKNVFFYDLNYLDSEASPESIDHRPDRGSINRHIAQHGPLICQLDCFNLEILS